MKSADTWESDLLSGAALGVRFPLHGPLNPVQSSDTNVPSFVLRLLEMRINASTEMFSLPASTRLMYTVDNSAFSASFS
jgi:hypothetical protein